MYNKQAVLCSHPILIKTESLSARAQALIGFKSSLGDSKVPLEKAGLSKIVGLEILLCYRGYKDGAYLNCS